MRKQTQLKPKVDQLLDELMQDYSSPEQILGEQGLIKQLSKRLIERALQTPTDSDNALSQSAHNSRNRLSAKTVHTDQGAFELQIPQLDYWAYTKFLTLPPQES